MTNLPELTNQLDEELETEERKERFRVNDDGAASWAMGHYRRIKKKQDENKQIGEQEIMRIQEWLASVNETLDTNANYFESLLLDYARRMRDTDGRKTISLPYGKVSSRNNGEKWTVNPEVFLVWANEHSPELIRIKQEPALSLIKERLTNLGFGKVITADGEMVPGVVVEPPKVTFTVSHDE